MFLHCAYTTSDDAFVHSIVVNSPRQCRSGTATNGATENCLFHTCIVVNSPRQCGSGTTSNGATENAAGFSESLRNCSLGGCTWRRPLTRACKYTCVHACTLRVIEGKQPRLEHHVCDLCSPSLLLLACFW